MTDGGRTVWTTTSAAETRSVGQEIGRLLAAGDVVLLHGDLGAGKTTLTKGIADSLGVAEEVQSPTFTVVAEYRAPQLGRDHWIIHVDLYRVGGESDLLSIGLDDVLDRDDSVVVVEWPERAGRAELPARLLVRIEGKGESRTISMSNTLSDSGS